METPSATRLALGTAQFGLDYGIANPSGQTSAQETKCILEFAQGRGMHLIDTAAAYGESERRLGDIGLGGWEVVTKIPSVPESASDIGQWVADSVTSSLTRLKIPRLYGLLLHRPEQLLGPMGSSLYAALLKLKEDRLVAKIGVSIYDPADLEPLMSRYQFDIVQSPFSVVDRRLLDSAWLYRLPDRGVELHVRSIFLQGLLLMSSESRPAKYSPWNPLWAAWRRWLEDNGATALQACLDYALSFAEINTVVLGIHNVRQLQEILSSTCGRLPAPSRDLQCADTRLINPSRWNDL